MLRFLERLFMNKTVVDTADKGVRKIIQYGGGKSAMIMNPRKKVITLFENGISAPKKMEEHMIIEGHRPIGHKEMKITDVLISDGSNKTTKLTLTELRPLDGDTGEARKIVDYYVNYGTSSQYQHSVTKYCDGTTSTHFNIG